MRAVLGCVLAASVLGGCTKASTPAGRTHPWTRPGVLRFAENEDVKSLNPLLFTSAPSLDLSMFIFSYAVRYDGNGQPVPDALSEIPTVANGDVSKDGLTLVYKLRHNILWQDGVPLTCKDLAFTWKFVMDPTTNTDSTEGYREIKTIDCPNPYTAVIHLKRPYAPFLQTIFGPNGNAPILPEHILAKYMNGKGAQNTAPFNSMPIGSGPFRVVQWQRGTVVRMVANPQYFLGPPKLKEVDYYIEPDENTMETQLQTHAIDMLARGTAINWPRYAALAADPRNGLKAVQVNSFLFDHIDFNLRSPILSDLHVRRALAYATNRQEIIEKIMHGAEYPSDTPEQPLFSWAHTNDVTHYPYDPDKARQVLDADGWKMGPGGVRVKNGRKLAILLSTQTESTLGRSLVALLQREWHDVGVQATIKNYPTAQFFENGTAGVVEGGHYDAATFAWNNGADPDLSDLYSANNLAPEGQNTLFWANAKATAALNDALRTVDQARRKRDYVVFQQQLADDVPTIVIGFRKEPFVYNTDLKGFDPSPVLSAFWDPWEYSI
jgi:peptide/nickel transport system substrate-binding protein